jgi:hypothetical protein
MKLRDHPLMNYRGMKSWPPVWVESSKKSPRKLMGEFGSFLGATLRDEMPMRLFVEMELWDHRYMGCVFISDVVFCRQVYSLLRSKKGLGIRDIGDLDVSHML